MLCLKVRTDTFKWFLDYLSTSHRSKTELFSLLYLKKSVAYTWFPLFDARPGYKKKISHTNIYYVIFLYTKYCIINTDEVSVSKYRSIPLRYPSCTLFKNNADTDPTLSIASGATIGIDSDTKINNPEHGQSSLHCCLQRWLLEIFNTCLIVRTLCDMPSYDVQLILTFKDPRHLIMFPIAVHDCISCRRGMFANDECYTEWDITSNWDPVSGSPPVHNVGPFGIVQTWITADSS
jgi:hypothetical protein